MTEEKSSSKNLDGLIATFFIVAVIVVLYFLPEDATYGKWTLKHLVSFKNDTYATCAGYGYKKKVHNDKIMWTVYREKWFFFLKKLLSSEKLDELAKIEIVSCDIFGDDEWLRVVEYTGGAHCCTISNWLRPDREGLFVDFRHGNTDVDERLYLKEEQPVFSVDDSSMAYFNMGNLHLSFAESFFLPQNICFRNNTFYDCTLTEANVFEQLKREEAFLLNPNLKWSKTNSNKIWKKIIKYIALSRLYGDDTYEMTLSQLGLSKDLIQNLETEVTRRLQWRKDHYGFISAKKPLTEETQDYVRSIEKIANELNKSDSKKRK